MNAIEDNSWSRAFRSLGALLPRPKAVLSISAHWFVNGTFLTAGAQPRTIHDFGGFPPELYRLQYPAPGDPELAARVARLLGEGRAALKTDWGLDHGTWSVLLHMLPAADCPVVQLSLDGRLPTSEHIAFGRALIELREQGVLIMGSGNITHNLRQAFSSLQRGELSTPAWALRFDGDVQRAVEQRDEEFLARALATGDGRMSHPTPDHYLPLLYAFGAAGDGEGVRFPITGFDLGSLSMRAMVFG
jgi:4,5-DOPA dioxygenase extradiol